MECGSRYINSLLQMRRMMIGFNIVWQYPETMLSLGPFEKTRGEVMADPVTCTSILARSVLIMIRYFLRMV